MVELDVQIPTTFDPFAEANDDSAASGTKGYVHIRIQQRNGRKSLTTVQGLKKEFSYEKILKDLKKEFCCNGTVVVDKELGKVIIKQTPNFIHPSGISKGMLIMYNKILLSYEQVIQLQGDQRKNVSNFLVQVISSFSIDRIS
ncbi:protein translation factor SUI1 homolog isoform X1 [Rhododendron vialii]|uniref:protein translation factor SUI1 homolog isoform X1 n=1 Tax=Rhododendron vialii TaxID=182163 RepID=UPI00265E3C95|nr:protein translation factor SUI1 homolog isoform X1 [Rhododendron vialii]